MEKISAISAAIFDCDGVLVDSETPWLDLLDEATQKLGIKGLRGEDFRGLSLNDAIELILGRIDPAAVQVDILEMYSQMHARYNQALKEITEPMPGVIELLNSMNNHIRLGVASNGESEHVLGLLKQVGVADYFDAVVTSEDVGRSKPEPDVYLAACQRLGVSPSKAVVFEDSDVGVVAARAAGCAVVGVGGVVSTGCDMGAVSLCSVVFEGGGVVRVR